MPREGYSLWRSTWATGCCLRCRRSQASPLARSTCAAASAPRRRPSPAPPRRARCSSSSACSRGSQVTGASRLRADPGPGLDPNHGPGPDPDPNPNPGPGSGSGPGPGPDPDTGSPGNRTFEDAAHASAIALWGRRSELDLLGAHINLRTGAWTQQDAGIGRGVDSFYEYMLKVSNKHSNCTPCLCPRRTLPHIHPACLSCAQGAYALRRGEG